MKPQTTKQIQERIIELNPELKWKIGLGTRVWNVLDNMNINSRDVLMRELGDGTWDAYEKSTLRKGRNFGRKCWMELCEWAGLPMPRIPNPSEMEKSPCPHCQGRGWVRHWKTYKPTKDNIRQVMSELGKRKKTMTPAAMEARRQSAIKSAIARSGR